MQEVLTQKDSLLVEVNKLQEKYELSKTVGPDYYEPGMMEHLEQYFGEFDETSNTIKICTDVKGLRYEGRTPRLDHINVGDPIVIEREDTNAYNPNNFIVLNGQNESLGNLPAELCNAIAPLYDSGYVSICESKVSYLERIKERSRYAKQGVLFIKITLQLKGI